MRRRSRQRPKNNRRRGDRPPYLLILIAIAAAIILVPTVFNTAAFSTVDLNRPESIDIVTDANGALTLDTVSAVNVGNQERLFTMTNRLNQSASVTVTITSGSGTLYTGTQSGSSVSFSLAKAASRTVDISAGGTGGDTIEYEIEASGTGMTATVTRTVQTLETGQAAPGYPDEFNDIDYPQCSNEEANENNSIPPFCAAFSEVTNFPNMQVASDSGAYAEIDSRDNALDAGFVVREPPSSISDFEVRIRYTQPSWSDDPTMNFVDESGNVLQSQTLEHTDSVLESEFIELNSAANNFVNNNDVFYVTFTGADDVQFEVDYFRIQEDTPPPEASFTFSCTAKDCDFDASASSGFGKPIVSYDWVWGDGNTDSTSSSTIDHTYASNGTYNVKLTVENSAGETDSVTRLVTVGTPAPTLIPPDFYDDIEHYENDPEAPGEDNDIPPPEPEGNKLGGDFDDMKQFDGNYATLEGDPMDIGVATIGVSDEASSYALKIRHAQHNYEGTVELLIVANNNTVLQTHQLDKDSQGDFINTTISFNSAAESYVRDTGNVYVRYHKTTGSWVDLQIDAHMVEVTP